MRVIFTGAVLLACLGAAFAQDDAPKVFRDPPAAFRPSPFWSWNGTLDDDELRRQVRGFKEQGYGGYFMHSRVGLVTRYLGDEWFHKIRVCLDEGRKQGLASWLYDEDKWPSGFAGGLVTHGHPEWVGQGLATRELAAGELGAALADPTTVAVYDMRDADFRRVTAATDRPAGKLVRFVALPDEPANWYNGEAYLDTLNPDAVAAFLRVTFTEGYDKQFRGDYGPDMPGVFTDEPNFAPGRGKPHGAVLPWTRRLPEIFRARRGYDLRDQLPLLLEPRRGYQKVRYDFWRTVAEQFETAYSKQYGEMAAKLGLQLTGHYLSEDTLSSQTPVTGSVMLHYLHQQMPGIDHLQRNVANALTKKQAASVARQFGRERVLSEIWGVSGHSATFEDLKWVADSHFALGVNFLVPHLTLYSMAGDRKRDYPPTFSDHQPYWPYMKTLNDYLARASYFVTRGKRQADILLLEPLGSVWSEYAPGQGKNDKSRAVETVERQFMETMNWLLASHRDFDLADEIILERAGRVDRTELLVGPEGRYRTVVVPPATRWNEETINLLARFVAAGGKVVARGPQPPLSSRWQRPPSGAVVGPSLDDLEAALKWAARREVSITDEAGKEIGDIVYHHASDDIMHFYFLSNTSHDTGYKANVKVWAQGFIEQWDLATGEVRQLESTTVDIPPRGSFAFTVLTSSPAFPMPDKPAVAAPRRETVAGPLKFKRLQPNVMVLDRCRYTVGSEAEQGPAPVSKARAAAQQAAGLGPHVGMQPWALEWKGIKVDRPVPVALRFEVESELDRPAAFLVVEHAGDYKVTVNGQPAPAPAGWQWDRQFGRIDVGARLKRGTNEIRLETTFKPGVEIEDAFLVGDFAVKQASETKYVIAREPAELRPGSWAPQGYPFFVGNMSYQVPVTFKKGEQVRLHLDRPVGTLFVVRAQGKEVARLAWQPWDADVTAALKPGRNVLEVVVVSSLENAFGPLHNDTYASKGNDWWFGPASFTDAEHWTDAYHHEPYGLGAVQIVRTAGGALAKK